MLNRHVLCALLMLPAAAPAMASQEEACRSESIIAELDRKDPKKVARILREAGEVENSQAMLWRVERGDTAPSYLFGTIHVGDRSLSELSPKTLVALRASSIVALEAEQVPAKQMPYIMAQAGKLMSARNRPLQLKLDSDELSVVERSLTAAGYPADLALGIRPWVAILFLTGSNCQGAETPGAKPLDLIISDEASRSGQKLVGLETMLEQFQSLADIDDDVQLSWLKTSIATHDRIDDITHTMAELYRFRRINAVWELTRELAPTAKLTDADLAAIQAGLVSKRNVRLLDRSVPLLEAGGAFVAVGALHLSGRDGLVEALRSRGYTLHPIE
jgi:uncharacterized protein YbaP (TraB family)